MKTKELYKELGITYSFYSRFVKRFFDFFLSLIAILVLSPILIILYLLNLIFTGFPAIYKQPRPGTNHKIFYIYKFRSMNHKKDKDGNLLPRDKRISKFGKILRKTSLDELPQLLNIFNGDMSIVGPRPVVEAELEKYGINKQKFLSVIPGLTGWWACNGRSCTSYEDRMKLELYYVNHRSLLLDLKIILKTFIAVIKRDGAE